LISEKIRLLQTSITRWILPNRENGRTADPDTRIRISRGIFVNGGSWKLCTNMRAEDLTDTLDLALGASGCDQVHVRYAQKLLTLD